MSRASFHIKHATNHILKLINKKSHLTKKLSNITNKSSHIGLLIKWRVANPSARYVWTTYQSFLRSPVLYSIQRLLRESSLRLLSLIINRPLLKGIVDKIGISQYTRVYV